MRYFLAIILSFLLLPSGGFAQDKLVYIGDLPEKIDVDLAKVYLDRVEKELGELSGKNRQFSSWNDQADWENQIPNGRRRTEDSFNYFNARKKRGSSNYQDWFDDHGIGIYVKINSRRSFRFLSGPGHGTVAFGFQIAGGCLVASVVTVKPIDKGLEKKIADIILRGIDRKPCD